MRLPGEADRPFVWSGQVVKTNYAGTQITRWDFQNKGTLTSPARLSFVLKVPLRYFRPALIGLGSVRVCIIGLTQCHFNVQSNSLPSRRINGLGKSGEKKEKGRELFLLRPPFLAPYLILDPCAEREAWERYCDSLSCPAVDPTVARRKSTQEKRTGKTVLLQQKFSRFTQILCTILREKPSRSHRYSFLRNRVCLSFCFIFSNLKLLFLNLD